MASSSNPIAESATISSNYYHVFLNHRGSDVKETLATHLHKRLSDKGLRVFLDKDELQEGDHIPSHLKGAIGSAIFSPNYAESSWCLNELLLMLESRKTIIPIFYGVKPDVLRWTLSGNGVYARHLSILEGKKSIDSRTRLQKPRYDTNTMEEWRRALSQAADLMGFVVEAEAFNRAKHTMFLGLTLVPALDPTLVLVLDPTLIPTPSIEQKRKENWRLWYWRLVVEKLGTWVLFVIVPSNY